jgi:hypothetical protein
MYSTCTHHTHQVTRSVTYVKSAEIETTLYGGTYLCTPPRSPSLFLSSGRMAPFLESMNSIPSKYEANLIDAEHGLPRSLRKGKVLDAHIQN